ncbi:hypothetical protein [Tabrizicola soli]|uniref:Uncharacterized protein n=1 Tax=Tabrizicola soli TaxID=2185115 RepID=A0ABV7DZI6_9RHOB|nr:hypothetical protein [Tabrizicola soli]
MSFERKIAGLGLPEVKAPTITPTDDQKPGVMVLSGGGVVAPERGHKNWGQTINQGFELRSLMTTAQYWEFTEADDPGFAVRPGEFGYFVVRSPGGPFLISLTKPDGVPTSQHTKLGKYRHRQRWCFLEVYYPTDTTLSFSSDYAFTTAAWKAELWEQEDLALLIGEDSPITYAMLAKGVVPQGLDELLAEGPRLAGTSDLFLISYNERTGKATVVLLSGPAGMEGMDPQEPDPDATEPVPGDGTTPPTPKPWDPKGPKPNTPNPETENEYTDPTTGLPLVSTPPPAGSGLLYALHGSSVSVSEDCGATWAPVNITGTGGLVDIVATKAGIFVLDDAGQVFTAPRIADPFQLVQLAETTTSKVEVAVVNGDFETGDLTGWTSLGAQPPRPLRTTQPPQRPGSKHYITRDWQTVTGPFKIRQAVEIPDGSTDLQVSVQCYRGDGDQIGTLRVVSQDDVALPTGTRTFVGNTCANFARSPEGEQLNLVVVSGTVSVFNGENGSSGTRVFELRRQDGSIYDRPVFLSIGDLDSHEELRFQESKVLAWFIGGSIATSTAGGLRYFTTTADNQNGGIILRDGAFAIHFVTLASSISLNGSPLPEWVNKTTVEVAATKTGQWEELSLPFPDATGALLIVELEGGGDRVDVYFDDVRITSGQNTPALQVLAIASVEGDQGGAELYLDGGILRHVADAAELGSTIPVPAPNITMADHDPESSRVASNGTDAWVWVDGAWSAPISGPFSSIVADPIPVLVRSNGEVLDAGYWASPGDLLFSLASGFTEAGGGEWHGSGDRRRSGILFTEASSGVLRSVATSGELPESTQPVSAIAVQRRSLPTDSGRILGWSVGSTDLFWTSELTVPWNVAGALGAPIIKIVELR